jgi:two-component system KDP operon response regulator KdpE
MSYSPHILIVDPEKEIRKGLHRILTDQGFRVTEAITAEDGIAKAIARPPDLIILELELPDIDGCDFCREVRQWTQLPILVLSARREEMSIVEALDAGADDYMGKPFNAEEFLARVRVALRRNQPKEHGEIFSFGDIEVDRERRLVRRNGTRVKLTAKEFELLVYLAQNAGLLLTYPMILRQVWGPDHSADVQYLRVYINQLRKKLEANPPLPRHILNEPQVGYRFSA